jgi:hypothetical protein
MTKTYKEPNPDECLFDNENFLSLEEIAENEIPAVDNEVNKEIDKEFFYKVFNNYFKQIYHKSERDFEIAKKFYGIGKESKNVPDLAEEYSLSNGRIREIVMKPALPLYKNRTKQVFNLINSPDLNKAINFESNPRLFLMQVYMKDLLKERGLI